LFISLPITSAEVLNELVQHFVERAETTIAIGSLIQCARHAQDRIIVAGILAVCRDWSIDDDDVSLLFPNEVLDGNHLEVCVRTYPETILAAILEDDAVIADVIRLIAVVAFGSDEPQLDFNFSSLLVELQGVRDDECLCVDVENLCHDNLPLYYYT